MNSKCLKFSICLNLFVLLTATEVLANSVMAPGQCRNQADAVEKYSTGELARLIRQSQRENMSPEEAYVNRLFVHLTGVPGSLSDPRFWAAVERVKAEDLLGAAAVVVTDANFLKVRVREFAIPYIDREHRTQDTLTDLQALIIGVVRDGIDARLLLTGNLRYSASRLLSLPAVSRSNNDHFAQFEVRNFDFERDLEKIEPQWSDITEAAGVLTTRAWAEAYYREDDTNRAPLKYSIDRFLCQPIDSWKIRGLPDYFVRRDIERAPAGNPFDYQNTCRNCHSAMDAFAGAFAKLDFAGEEFIFSTTGAVPKMNRNAQFYPPGYITTDDSWQNMLLEHPTIHFGWHGTPQGMGVHAFASYISAADAFPRCFVQRVFAEVCGKNIFEAAANQVPVLVSEFVQNRYNLKFLFQRVATLEACVAHPPQEMHQ